MFLSPVENAIALPYEAVYGSNNVFKITSNQLQRIEIERFGQITSDQETYIVAVSDQLNDGDFILTTQLVNANDGLAVQISNQDE